MQAGTANGCRERVPRMVTIPERIAEHPVLKIGSDSVESDGSARSGEFTTPAFLALPDVFSS
jgi:hypothetical protein